MLNQAATPESRALAPFTFSAFFTSPSIGDPYVKADPTMLDVDFRCVFDDLPLPELEESPAPRQVRIAPIPRPCIHFSREDSDQQMILPILERADTVPRISPDTMAELLQGGWKDQYDVLIVVDCRYPYEYEGGCIPNAININDPAKFHAKFFDCPLKRCVIVFHCELSKTRGPKLAAMFRDIDRDKNKDAWPHLDYPDVYVLDGGYRGFYSQFPDLCHGGYVKMRDTEHICNGDIVKSTSKFRSSVGKIFANRREALKTLNPAKLNSLTSPIAIRKPDTGIRASPVPCRARTCPLNEVLLDEEIAKLREEANC